MTTGLPESHPIVTFVLARAREVGRADAERLEQIAVIDHFGRRDHPSGPYHCVSQCSGGYPCTPIRRAAAAFAEHPDYRPEWRP